MDPGRGAWVDLGRWMWLWDFPPVTRARPVRQRAATWLLAFAPFRPHRPEEFRGEREARRLAVGWRRRCGKTRHRAGIDRRALFGIPAELHARLEEDVARVAAGDASL